MSEFTVFHRSLNTTARSFAQSASSYESTMPDDGFPVPRGGNLAIDRMMELTLKALGNAHSIVADVIDSHSFKLVQASATYSEAESKTLGAVQEVEKSLRSGYSGYSIPDVAGGQPKDSVLGNPTLGKFRPDPPRIAHVPAGDSISLSALQYLDNWSAIGDPAGFAGAGYDPWIGGDFKGMINLVSQLRVFKEQSTQLVDDLKIAAKKLIGSTGDDWQPGWHGPAAAMFAQAFANDAAAMQSLGDVVAEKFAAHIDWLVWRLYGMELQLEERAQVLLDQGCRIQSAEGKLYVNPPPGVVPSMPQNQMRDHINDLNSLFSNLHNKANKDRNVVARQLNDLFDKCKQLLQHHADKDNANRTDSDLNPTQSRKLADYQKNLGKMEKDYKEVSKHLQVHWLETGKAALDVAAGTGPWAPWTSPALSIIKAFLGIS
ncbi:DUF6317 family protein [Actinomadura nitritigenes]|uniref:DUF6317 family protein n=1 Tax=Actinomadura nitritigenes TaxID=134602 RepID=UPI003D91E2B5